MKQKNKSSYPEVISMEEYLTKRKKIKEKAGRKRNRSILTKQEAWAFAELYI